MADKFPNFDWNSDVLYQFFENDLSSQIFEDEYLTQLILNGAILKIWNGAAWVEKPIKIWNGAAWVEKPIKIWNGAAWE